MQQMQILPINALPRQRPVRRFGTMDQRFRIPLHDLRQRSYVVKMAMRDENVRESIKVINFDRYRRALERYKWIKEDSTAIRNKLHRRCAMPYDFSFQ